MADSVFYHLERMLPELDDLKERGLFSAAEVKEIARRRREFEFRLERRSKLKEDYLNYIQYELQLEKLRLLRKKALVRELHTSNRRWQPSLCDRASAMRVMLIYERATTRFKGDLNLWMQYLRYCRSQGTRRMQKVLTKVLRLHPTVPGVWIYAAAWEFEHNADITAARALMQRGLRICSESEKLWLEYFRMELVYAERLKANSFNPVVEKKNANAGHNGDEEEDGLILRIDEGDEEELGETKVVPREHKAGMDSIKIDELAYKLACTIYKNAVTALPSSLEFRKNFMEMLQKASFTQASSLQDEIFKSLEKDFPMDAGCWDWQARVRFKVTGEIDEAIKVYENALGAVSTVDMYELYAQFLKEVSGLEFSNTQHSSIALEHSKVDRILAATHLLSLYCRAKEGGVLSPGLAEGHAIVLLRLGKLDEARQVLEEFCMGQFRSCTRVWAIRIMLEMKIETIDESCLSRIADLCEQSLKHIAIADAGELWALVLEYFGGQASVSDRIVDIMIYKLAGSVGDQTSALLACSLIDWIFVSQDIKHARRVYDRILALPGPGIYLYRHCINIECQMAAMGCKDAPKCMRRLFESAVVKYSQDAELWLEYCSQEMKAGNLDAAGSIYWRAKKTLHDPSAFIEGHQRLRSKEGN
eukprot:c22471_g1_i2 orf=145-2082(+)